MDITRLGIKPGEKGFEKERHLLRRTRPSSSSIRVANRCMCVCFVAVLRWRFMDRGI